MSKKRAKHTKRIRRRQQRKEQAGRQRHGKGQWFFSAGGGICTSARDKNSVAKKEQSELRHRQKTQHDQEKPTHFVECLWVFGRHVTGFLGQLAHMVVSELDAEDVENKLDLVCQYKIPKVIYLGNKRDAQRLYNRFLNYHQYCLVRLQEKDSL